MAAAGRRCVLSELGCTNVQSSGGTPMCCSWIAFRYCLSHAPWINSPRIFHIQPTYCPVISGLFGAAGAAVHELGPPTEEQRAAFFEAVSRTLADPPLPIVPRQRRAPPPVSVQIASQCSVQRRAAP